MNESNTGAPRPTTREAWLIAATEKFGATFTRAGAEIPPVQIACGWPSRRGLGTKNRLLGECWDKKCSADAKPQIFISPWLDNELHCIQPADAAGFGVGDFMGVLPTLAHELVHAVAGNAAKHGKDFKKLAVAVGLEGPMTSTHAGARLAQECEDIYKILGPYPHAKINPLEKGGHKKQKTRMVKCECAGCGYVVRTAKKWLDEIGAPHCPKHGSMSFELPELNDDGETDGEN